MNPNQSYSNRENTTRHKYLIIGGAPKSGTTSLFRYLSDHPEVCPANRKETYFFAREFDLSKVCTYDETLVDFDKYFSHCSSAGNLRIEATPYTIYAKDAAKKISMLLPNSSVLFILRNPIKRLVSDYRFHVQRNHRSAQGTLEDYFEWQHYMRGDIPNSLKMGHYIEYIRGFINEFGRSRVHVLIFDDFIANPMVRMQELSNILGIDESFYHTYNFTIHNPTIKIKSSRLNTLSMHLELVVADIRTRTLSHPRLNKAFNEIMRLSKIIYWKLNDQGSSDNEMVTPQALSDLEDYYRPYNDALSDELGLSLPW